MTRCAECHCLTVVGFLDVCGPCRLGYRWLWHELRSDNALDFLLDRYLEGR